MYTENALFFPKTAIASLQKLRGAQWEALVERVTTLPETHEETLALMLLMIQLNGCLTCETDSYRAMRGCCACAVTAGASCPPTSSRATIGCAAIMS